LTPVADRCYIGAHDMNETLIRGALALAAIAFALTGVFSAAGRPRRREACVFVACAILAVLYSGVWSGLATHFRAGNDPIQDAWVLTTVTGNLLTRPAQLFDGNLFHPSYGSVLYADPLLGPAMLVLPLRVASDNGALLYNAALLLGLTLAGYGFYRVALRLWGDPRAALLAAIVIPYTAQQMHHLELAHLPYLSIAGFPFLMLSLLELLERPRWTAAIATGVTFAFQAGTDGYYAFCCAFLAAIFALWSWRRFRHASTWMYAIGAAALGGLLMWPYVRGFAALRQEADMSRGLDWALRYSTDLGISLFRNHSVLWSRLLQGPELPGGPLFPGLVVLVLAVIALRRAAGPYRTLLLAVFAFFFLLSMGPELRFRDRSIAPLPFKLLWQHLPFFNAMRHPITFAVPGLMALGLLAAGGLARTRIVTRPALLGLVLLLAVGETLIPRPPRQDRGREMPEAYVFLAGQPRGGILELPFEGNYTYEWWAIRHGLPVINGELGFEPKRYAQLHHLITKEWDRRPAHQDMEAWASLAFLKGQFPVRYLVLHPNVSGYVRSHVDATPRTFELLRETAAGDRVYHLRRGGTGPQLKRRFRDDQLRGASVRATVRGPQGAVLTATLNDRGIGQATLSETPAEVEWKIPDDALVRGLNTVSFEAQAGEGSAPFELLDVETGEPGKWKP
jgi:hypothetical protein